MQNQSGGPGIQRQTTNRYLLNFILFLKFNFLKTRLMIEYWFSGYPEKPWSGLSAPLNTNAYIILGFEIFTWDNYLILQYYNIMIILLKYLLPLMMFAYSSPRSDYNNIT